MTGLRIIHKAEDCQVDDVIKIKGYQLHRVWQVVQPYVRDSAGSMSDVGRVYVSLFDPKRQEGKRSREAYCINFDRDVEIIQRPSAVAYNVCSFVYGSMEDDFLISEILTWLNKHPEYIGRTSDEIADEWRAYTKKLAKWMH